MSKKARESETAAPFGTGFVESRDGTQLYSTWLDQPDAKAKILVVHGFGEHCGRYEHVMRRLHACGYDVCAFDYRGHGRSQGRRSFIIRFAKYLDDLDAFIRFAMSRGAANSKVYLLGHSLGGLIVSSYVLEQPEGIDGIILSSPFLGFKVKVNPAKALLAKVMSGAWPTLALPTELPSSDLSTDEAVGLAYDADPLVNKVATTRWFTETVDQQEMLVRDANRITVPTLLLQAGDDRIADADVAQNFLAVIGAADKELRWYDGMFHEIFNEVRKDEVFNDLEAWLQKHV